MAVAYNKAESKKLNEPMHSKTNAGQEAEDDQKKNRLSPLLEEYKALMTELGRRSNSPVPNANHCRQHPCCLCCPDRRGSRYNKEWLEIWVVLFTGFVSNLFGLLMTSHDDAIITISGIFQKVLRVKVEELVGPEMFA